MSIKPLRTKDETANALVEIVNILENATDPQYNVKFIKANRGGEFHNKDLQTELRQRGIQLKETVPQHSETNAVAERANRNTLTMSRTALIAADVPKEYWDKALPKVTPIELLIPETHAKQLLRPNLRPFGQKVKCFDYEVSDKLFPRGYEGRIPIPTKPAGY